MANLYVREALIAIALGSSAQAKQAKPVDLSLYAAVASARAADYMSTEHFLNHCGHEVILPDGLVREKPLFAAYSIGMAAAEVMAARILSRRHPVIARYVLAIDASATAATAAHNYEIGCDK